MEKNNIKVINLSAIDDQAYSYGEYNSYASRWINYGKYNNYPEYLKKLYLSSPTHQAIIDGVINMATGEGIEVVNPEQNPLSNKWINENFPPDVIKKLLGDLKLYGYCVVEIYSGEIVKYTDALKWRFDHKDDTGNINYMWYSNDWEYYTSRKNQPKKVPVYREGSDEEVSVLYARLDTKGYDYYSPVDYNGSINYISLETEISKYHLSNIQNGLFPSFVITFVGTEFSDEQMDKIEQNVNKKFGGSGNTGRAILSFAASKDDAPVLETVDQPTISETYEFLSKECSEKILIGHGVTSPIMFGIRDSGGGLGNNSEELQQSYNLFYESKLKHYQNIILKMVRKVMDGNLLYGKIDFLTYNPFSVTTSTQQMSKVEQLSEVAGQVLIHKLDKIKVKVNDTLIREKIMDQINEKSFYKFVKSSNKNNILIKKFEMLDKNGYLFKPDAELIKNTKDYFFKEMIFMKK